MAARRLHRVHESGRRHCQAGAAAACPSPDSLPGLIATVGVLLMLPWLVAALHIGVLVDRLDRRLPVIRAETGRMASGAAPFPGGDRLPGGPRDPWGPPPPPHPRPPTKHPPAQPRP